MRAYYGDVLVGANDAPTISGSKFQLVDFSFIEGNNGTTGAINNLLLPFVDIQDAELDAKNNYAGAQNWKLPIRMVL